MNESKNMPYKSNGGETCVRSLSWANSAGLAALYSSGYFLPLIGDASLAFMPSLWQDLFWPTLVCIAILTPIIWLAHDLCRERLSRRANHVLRLIAFSALSLLAIRGALGISGYHWMTLVYWFAGIESHPDRQRLFQIIVSTCTLAGLVLVLHLLQRSTLRVSRLLASVGFAFLMVCVYRTYLFSHGKADSAESAPQLQASTAAEEAAAIIPAGKRLPTESAKPRFAVWVIFDELDYGEAFGEQSTVKGQLKNLEQLQKRGVSAINAYSPERDTHVSLPALLTGRQNYGIVYSGPAKLKFKYPDQSLGLLDNEASIFSKLPGGLQSAGVMGFYLPYCQIFHSLGYCRSLPMQNSGRWYDALTFFGRTVTAAVRWVPHFGQVAPGWFFYAFDPMFRISTEIVDHIPEMLSEPDLSLAFLHINLPHPPGWYAQKTLGMPQTADEHATYRQNLMAADAVLGKIVGILEAQAGEREILLLVSADHWYRLESPKTAQRIPLLIWRVGETAARTISGQINTVSTERMVRDFLAGKVSTQEEFQRWWIGKTFTKPVIPGDE